MPTSKAKKITYKLNTKKSGGSFIFYEVETMSTSPFLNISTNVSYSANRNSWSDESCQGHCSKPATWCCMPNVFRHAQFGMIVEYIDHVYLVGKDEYSKSVKDAYYHIWNWSIDKKPDYYRLYHRWSIICTGSNRLQCLISGEDLQRQVYRSVSQM